MELKRSRKKVLIKRIIGYLLLFFIPILLTATIIYFYDNLSSKSNILFPIYGRYFSLILIE